MKMTKNYMFRALIEGEESEGFLYEEGKNEQEAEENMKRLVPGKKFHSFELVKELDDEA